MRNTLLSFAVLSAVALAACQPGTEATPPAGTSPAQTVDDAAPAVPARTPAAAAPTDAVPVVDTDPRRVLAGKVWLPEGMDLTRRDSDLPAPLASLTRRERQVLRAIRAGRMNKEIAGDLHISEVTVKMHVRAICQKLGARNRTQAALMAAGADL